MTATVKLPEGVTADQLKNAMDVLRNDPNFEILSKFVQANDMAVMRSVIEDPNVDVSELRKAQYRLSVFKEFLTLPAVLFEKVRRGMEETKVEEDTYHDSDSIREARGQ